MGRLAPLREEPMCEEERPAKRNHSFRSWLAKGSHSFRNWIQSHKESDLRILLSVVGCPLSPVSTLPKQPRETMSSAQYIIQQFWATTGCGKMERAVKNMYALGTLRVVMAHHELTQGSPGNYHEGRFVVWQMTPNMWLFDLSVSGHHIIAGSDGRVAWRRTPWFGAHAASGGIRPLRRALQGLDPLTIVTVFSNAKHIGEKDVDNEECFMLQLDVDTSTLSSRSDETAEIISHVMVGYFSQRSGLLVHLEDSQLTRLQSSGAQPMYWLTTIATRVVDYREIDGMKIAHSGHSIVKLGRFSATLKAHQVAIGMEESWTIDDVVFNVVGLSADNFMPPKEIQKP